MKVFDVLVYEGYGFLCVSDDENSCSYVAISENRLKDFSRNTGTSPMIEDFLRQLNYNPLSKPLVSETSPALQEIWKELCWSESGMVFIGYDSSEYWEDIGLSQEDFVFQVEKDIAIFGLSDVIEQGINDCLFVYLLYGAFGEIPRDYGNVNGFSLPSIFLICLIRHQFKLNTADWPQRNHIGQ